MDDQTRFTVKSDKCLSQKHHNLIHFIIYGMLIVDVFILWWHIDGKPPHREFEMCPALVTSSRSTKNTLWQTSIFADTLPRPRMGLTQGQWDEWTENNTTAPVFSGIVYKHNHMPPEYFKICCNHIHSPQILTLSQQQILQSLKQTLIM